MIGRYSTKEMTEIWSGKKKFENWARVEIAVLEAKYNLGYIKEPPTHGLLHNLLDRLTINPAEIDRIEAEKTRHDVKAFLEHTNPQLPEEFRPHWHHRMTSYDPQDTGLSLTLVESTYQLMQRNRRLMEAIAKRAFEHKYTVMMGRTHGVHAEPITYGVELANYYDELHRHEVLLTELNVLVAVGKLSGAVGMYSLPPEIESYACERLGLKPITATQIIPRDIIARYMVSLAIIGGTIEKIAVNIRNLQRTEIREVQEYFDPNQTGSTAMPHKRNPVGSENLSGLSSVLRGNAVAALEKISTWHQRDISNSGPERIYLPDSSILLDYMLKRMTNIIEKLLIYPKRMEKNLQLSKGLIYSQEVQACLAEKGSLPREEAHEVVRRIAQRCWDSEEDFHNALMQNEIISQHIKPEELSRCFNLAEKIKYVDYIFGMVFKYR